jgi:hypothetical protein
MRRWKTYSLILLANCHLIYIFHIVQNKITLSHWCKKKRVPLDLKYRRILLSRNSVWNSGCRVNMWHVIYQMGWEGEGEGMEEGTGTVGATAGFRRRWGGTPPRAAPPWRRHSDPLAAPPRASPLVDASVSSSTRAAAQTGSGRAAVRVRAAVARWGRKD